MCQLYPSTGCMEERKVDEEEEKKDEETKVEEEVTLCLPGSNHSIHGMIE